MPILARYGKRRTGAHGGRRQDRFERRGQHLDNPLLARTMEQLSWQLQLLFGLREEPAQMRAQHTEMFRHIAAGDGEAAAASTLLHVRDSRSVALRSLFGNKD